MASEVLVQPDGKILVVGNGAANDFAVTRLSAEGAIDRSYGNNGTAVGDFAEDDRTPVDTDGTTGRPRRATFTLL